MNTNQRNLTIALLAVSALLLASLIPGDLAQLFPRSPTSMSQALSLIEVLGMCAAVPLMYLSWPYTPFASQNSRRQERDEKSNVSENESTPMTGFRVALMAVLIAFSVGIILFATDSAMNPATGAVFLAQ